MLLQKLGKANLDVVRSLFAILAMAIADTKVVAEVAAAKVRAEDEAILVNLVGVVRYEADSGREGILGDYIAFNELGLGKRLREELRWCRGS